VKTPGRKDEKLRQMGRAGMEGVPKNNRGSIKEGGGGKRVKQLILSIAPQQRHEIKHEEYLPAILTRHTPCGTACAPNKAQTTTIK